MSELFVFDLNNLLQAKIDKAANLANYEAESGIPRDSVLMTSANANAIEAPDRERVADISASLSGRNPPQEPALAGLSTLAEGSSCKNHFPFTKTQQILPAELEQLIPLIARYYDCLPGEVEEMREVAGRDVAGALITYRAMATEITGLETDKTKAQTAGMATCRECARLVAGHCLAARENRIKGAAREYIPVPDIYRRCPVYCPRMNQP